MTASVTIQIIVQDKKDAMKVNVDRDCPTSPSSSVNDERIFRSHGQDHKIKSPILLIMGSGSVYL